MAYSDVIFEERLANRSTVTTADGAATAACKAATDARLATSIAPTALI